MHPTLTTRQEQDPTTPLTPVSPWPPALVETNVDLPSAKETYGFLAVILTYLGFGTYCIWAFVPDHILHRFGWTWYPNRLVTCKEGRLLIEQGVGIACSVLFDRSCPPHLSRLRRSNHLHGAFSFHPC